MNYDEFKKLCYEKIKIVIDEKIKLNQFENYYEKNVENIYNNIYVEFDKYYLFDEIINRIILCINNSLKELKLYDELIDPEIQIEFS